MEQEQMKLKLTPYEMFLKLARLEQPEKSMFINQYEYNLKDKMYYLKHKDGKTNTKNN